MYPNDARELLRGELYILYTEGWLRVPTEVASRYPILDLRGRAARINVGFADKNMSIPDRVLTALDECAARTSAAVWIPPAWELPGTLPRIELERIFGDFAALLGELSMERTPVWVHRSFGIAI